MDRFPFPKTRTELVASLRAATSAVLRSARSWRGVEIRGFVLIAACATVLAVFRVDAAAALTWQSPPVETSCPANCNPAAPPATGYGIRANCESTNGKCPPGPMDCSWTCRLKIVSDGQAIPCPMDGNVIDYDALEASPETWPDCAAWHLPSDSPTWSSSDSGASLPGDGASEGTINKILDCEVTKTETYTATADSGAFATAFIEFQCGGDCP